MKLEKSHLGPFKAFLVQNLQFTSWKQSEHFDLTNSRYLIFNDLTLSSLIHYLNVLLSDCLLKLIAILVWKKKACNKYK